MFNILPEDQISWNSSSIYLMVMGRKSKAISLTSMPFAKFF